MIHPPIDELLKQVPSKYALVIIASKRARQINAYHHQLGEGEFDDVRAAADRVPLEELPDDGARGARRREDRVGGPGSDLRPTAPGPPLLLGVTGGIAAYRACELVRLLVKAGLGVQVAMTARRRALRRRRDVRGSQPAPGAARRAGARRQLPAPRRVARRAARVHRAVHREHAGEARARPRRQRRDAERAGGAGPARRRAGDERAHVGAPGDPRERGDAARRAASCSSGPRTASSPRASRAWAA